MTKDEILTNVADEVSNLVTVASELKAGVAAELKAVIEEMNTDFFGKRPGNMHNDFDVRKLFDGHKKNAVKCATANEQVVELYEQITKLHESISKIQAILNSAE